MDGLLIVEEEHFGRRTKSTFILMMPRHGQLARDD